MTRRERQDGASPGAGRQVQGARGPRLAASTMSVVVTLGGLAASFALLALLPFPVSLLTIPLCAGFLVRSFILMHDCCHGSLFRSRRANGVIGFITGVLTTTPFVQWRRSHAIHHAGSGCLEKRGTGDIRTLTIAEYRALSRSGRLAYRCYRHPLVLLGLGPLWLFLAQRRCGRSRKVSASERANVYATNVGVVAMLGGLFALFGPLEFVAVFLPTIQLASAAGIWLFYVQHQFEDAYWARAGHWNYAQAAISGSSWYRLPRPLDWITGSIGFHHVHHLDPRIPHYDLRARHTADPRFAPAHVLTLRESVRTFRLKLWDEERGVMIGWRDLRGRMSAACGP